MDMVDVKKLIQKKEEFNKDMRLPEVLATFLEAIEKVQIQRNENYSLEEIERAWDYWKAEHLGDE